MEARGIPFDKYEGLGNDFIVVEAERESDVSAASAVALCDRRRGIGADGVLLVLPSGTPQVDARMHVLNADGSVPEMCGNGIRCVAMHLVRRRAGASRVSLSAMTLRIDTGTGVRECRVEDAPARQAAALGSHDPENTGGVGVAGLVTVDMGIVRSLGERSLELGGERLKMRLADIGNPHAILFGSYSRADVERLGPAIATHPTFARGTNVEFARVEGGEIELVVWERGVGITLACGTGACATAAVACADGLVPGPGPISVHLPGGRLEVTLEKDGAASDRNRGGDGGHASRVIMRGPARHVFSGVA